MRKWLTSEYILLLLICIFGFILRAYNLNYNSFFVDEAFYIVIGQQILEGQIERASGAVTWVGAFPLFYPLLSGFFYSLGGLYGTRLLNVELGTVCIVLIFTLTQGLGLFKTKRENNIAGLVAAGLLATTAVPIQLSRLAIYDMLSFTLFLAGLNLYLRAFKTNHKYWALSASVAFFLAFLAKYIVMFYIPLFVFGSFFLPKKISKVFLHYFSLPLFLSITLYILVYFSALLEFFSTQLGDPSTTHLDVIVNFLNYSFQILAIALAGAYVFYKKNTKIIKLLIFLALIPVVVHVLTKNNASSQQHTFLLLIFVFPLAAAFFVHLLNKYGRIGYLAIAAFIVFNLYYSYPLVQDSGANWPDSSKAAQVIKSKVNENDLILAEGSDSIYLGIDRKISYDNVAGPFVFEYKGLEGIRAYEQAIEDKYFKIVELEDAYFSDEDIKIIEEKLSQDYKLIFNDHEISVYERN